MSDYSSLSHSVTVLVEVIESRCSGYTSPMSTTSGSGVIKSPRYPGTYYTNENCRWNLNFRFDHAHYLVLFDVKEMQISYQSIYATTKTCTGHLSVFGGKATLISFGRFCFSNKFRWPKRCTIANSWKCAPREVHILLSYFLLIKSKYRSQFKGSILVSSIQLVNITHYSNCGISFFRVEALNLTVIDSAWSMSMY